MIFRAVFDREAWARDLMRRAMHERRTRRAARRGRVMAPRSTTKPKPQALYRGGYRFEFGEAVIVNAPGREPFKAIFVQHKLGERAGSVWVQSETGELIFVRRRSWVLPAEKS